MLASARAYAPLLRRNYQHVPVPIVGPSTKGVTAKFGAERSINWYPEDEHRLRARPGLETIATLPHRPIRGAYIHQDRYFVVAKQWVYELEADGTLTEWGTIGTASGKVTMAGLLNVLVIGDGGRFYALDLDAGTITAIADAPAGRFCVFFNQRILYQGENGQVYYSELNDATNIPGLNFFTAESLPDDIVAMATTEDRIWLIGSDSSQPFYDSGDVDNPFVPIPGGTIYVGTNSPDTVLRLDNSIWLVGKDKEGSGIVWRSAGSQFTRVSTSPVERFTASATNLSAHSYQEEGSTFYVLNADEGTWAFDIKTGVWCERAWLNRNTGIQERARPETHCFAYGLHYVTDYTLGKVYRQGLDLHSDAGQEIRRTRITPRISFDGRQVVMSELWLDFATGAGLDGLGQGTDPQVMLRVSGDGVTFGSEIMAPIGAIGAFDTCVRFHDLGIGRDWVFEISVSDPVLTGMMGGSAKIVAGTR